MSFDKNLARNTTLDGLTAANPQTLFRRVKNAIAPGKFKASASTHSNSEIYAAGLMRRKT